MGDPFASISSDCIIPSNLEASLGRAAFIGEPCIFSTVCDCFGKTAAADAPPISPSESPRPPAATMLDEEDLMDIPASPEPSPPSPAPWLVKDLGTLVKSLMENPDWSLRRRDILEIAESRGLFFAKPSWWRLGGYEQESLGRGASFGGEEGSVSREALDLAFDE